METRLDRPRRRRARLDPLKGSDRRRLRSLANPLKVVVRVGEAGCSDAVVAAVDAALRDHELIKVKITADRDQRRGIALQIARAAHCALAGTVGRVAIFYRPADDPATRRIQLPSAPP